MPNERCELPGVGPDQGKLRGKILVENGEVDRSRPVCHLISARFLLPLAGAMAGGVAAYSLSRLGAEVPPHSPEAPLWQLAAAQFTLFGIHTTLGIVLGLAAGVLVAEAVRRRSE